MDAAVPPLRAAESTWLYVNLMNEIDAEDTLTFHSPTVPLICMQWESGTATTLRLRSSANAGVTGTCKDVEGVVCDRPPHQSMHLSKYLSKHIVHVWY